MNITATMPQFGGRAYQTALPKKYDKAPEVQFGSWGRGSKRMAIRLTMWTTVIGAIALVLSQIVSPVTPEQRYAEQMLQVPCNEGRDTYQRH